MTAFWERAVASFVARLIYFVVMVLGMPVATVLLVALVSGESTSPGTQTRSAPLYLHTVLSEFPMSPYWLAVLGLGIFAAVFGPEIYRKKRERGRGLMRKIREESRLGNIGRTGLLPSDPAGPERDEE
ncbi:MAG: hypothetical protein L3K26_07035 [Candidatus Hydrogenedentes bacterium]|nr:hypothetical protein [Candidatus Hydrogenedentota bacterium]